MSLSDKKGKAEGASNTFGFEYAVWWPLFSFVSSIYSFDYFKATESFTLSVIKNGNFCTRLCFRSD
jgi:hypothetical protein